MCSRLRNCLFCVIAALFAFTTISAPNLSAQETEFRYEKDIVDYEKKSRETPPPDDCTIFIGSSTWRMWGDQLEKDFAEFNAVNRGFGGSTVPDQLHVMHRLVLPYKPARIAFFCGGNDTARGTTGAETFGNFKTFLARLWAESPKTEVFFVSVTAAPVREQSREQTLEFNRLVRELAEKTERLHYVDTFATLAGEDGKAQEKYFLQDRLHLNRDGQERWIPVIKKVLQEARESKVGDSLEKEIAVGNFSAARTMIDAKMIDPATPPKEAWELLLRREILDRIERDFNTPEEKVVADIKRYYPDVTPEQIVRWKIERSLEAMTIDGKKRYFARAVPNLFRIDKAAIARKREIDGPDRDNLNAVLTDHLPKIIAASKAENRPTHLEPKRMSVTYTLTVPADTVPEGETLRCWLPYPREDHRRQSDVEFVGSNLENPIISPSEYKHCSVYAEKIAVKGEPTVFQIKFRYTAYGECFDLDEFDVKPYDENSAVYKEYTAERERHVVFTGEIKRLSEQFVGDEKAPVKVVQKIFEGVTSTYPWASAREYSTVDNIPVYVINEGHGDCGMVGLLLVTLCRYNGIPAKWQSGFMMHPGAKNLHDWAEVYFEGVGWVPIDSSFGRRKFPDKPELDTFFCSGIDSWRWIVNDDYGMAFYPAKIFPRSETVDFQRGEVEWRGGNLFFDQWRWNFDIEYEN